MSNIVIFRKTLDSAVELCDSGIEVYESYSGRGMFGDSCVGIVVDDMSDAFKFFAAYTIVVSDVLTSGNFQYKKEALDLAASAKIDNLGHKFIIYWPDTKYVKL